MDAPYSQGAVLCAAPEKRLASRMMNIILDTDIDTDCDDAGALAVLHALQSRGDITILGVICCVPQEDCASCVWAINAAYGRSDIPVGLVRIPDWIGNSTYESYRCHRAECTEDNTKPLYNKVITASVAERLPDNIHVDAVTRYRELLSSAPDGSVTVCAIGTLTALAQLLDSGPDEISDLSGRSLVARKVRTLVSMAEAAHPSGRDCFNWRTDRVSAAKVITEWPTDLVVSNMGRNIRTGRRLMSTLPADHPVHQAYRTFLGSTDADRPSWDQLAVMYAASGPSAVFTEHWESGLLFDEDSGAHEWGVGECAGRRGHTSSMMELEALAEQVEDLMIEAG